MVDEGGGLMYVLSELYAESASESESESEPESEVSSESESESGSRSGLGLASGVVLGWRVGDDLAGCCGLLVWDWSLEFNAGDDDGRERVVGGAPLELGLGIVDIDGDPCPSDGLGRLFKGE